jgi:hypothetical protein
MNRTSGKEILFLMILLQSLALMAYFTNWSLFAGQKESLRKVLKIDSDSEEICVIEPLNPWDKTILELFPEERFDYQSPNIPMVSK